MKRSIIVLLLSSILTTYSAYKKANINSLQKTTVCHIPSSENSQPGTITSPRIPLEISQITPVDSTILLPKQLPPRQLMPTPVELLTNKAPHYSLFPNFSIRGNSEGLRILQQQFGGEIIISRKPASAMAETLKITHPETLNLINAAITLVKKEEFSRGIAEGKQQLTSITLTSASTRESQSQTTIEPLTIPDGTTDTTLDSPQPLLNKLEKTITHLQRKITILQYQIDKHQDELTTAYFNGFQKGSQMSFQSGLSEGLHNGEMAGFQNAQIALLSTLETYLQFEQQPDHPAFQSLNPNFVHQIRGIYAKIASIQKQQQSILHREEFIQNSHKDKIEQSFLALGAAASFAEFTTQYWQDSTLPAFLHTERTSSFETSLDNQLAHLNFNSDTSSYSPWSTDTNYQPQPITFTLFNGSDIWGNK